MAVNRRKRKSVSPIYSFAVTWLILSLILPLYRLWALLLVIAASVCVSYLFGKRVGKKQAQEPVPAQEAAHEETGHSPEVEAVLQEGNRALSEMGRLYSSIKDAEVRAKINELMRITDKITQDAVDDPSDIPQIKKFLNYYLPTTIKLLNAYDRMSSQGIEGDNLNKSMKSINEMLDEAIVAFRKRLDSLFADQALDIETDIAVMNQMLEREGLSGEKDFKF